MNGMTAQRLRIVLFIVMVLIMVAAVAGFTVVQKNLANYATSISKLNADAQSGDKDIKTLQELKSRLAAEQDIIQKTRAVVGDTSTYADTVISDISLIGARSGVPVRSITFAGDTVAETTPQGVPSASSTPTQTFSSPTVTKKTVTVSIQSPLSYTSLMKFLAGIESNELRMHIARVAMTKDKDDSVSTQDLILEVYVRK